MAIAETINRRSEKAVDARLPHAKVRMATWTLGTLIKNEERMFDAMSSIVAVSHVASKRSEVLRLVAAFGDKAFNHPGVGPTEFGWGSG